MAKRKPGPPWIKVTAIRGLLSGDDKCRWKAWFGSRFNYRKHVREDDDFDLDAWRRDHDAMVLARARFLQDAGYTVYLEGQNEFKIKGRKLGAFLVGKPDIVAVKIAAPAIGPVTAAAEGVPVAGPILDVLLVDCKTGKEKDADRWQVLTYLYAYTVHEHPGFPLGTPIRAEVEYPGKSYAIKAEQFTDRERQAILTEIGTIAMESEPMRMPSETECHYCDISGEECKSRVMPKPAAETGDF